MTGKLADDTTPWMTRVEQLLLPAGWIAQSEESAFSMCIEGREAGRSGELCVLARGSDHLLVADFVCEDISQQPRGMLFDDYCDLNIEERSLLWFGARPLGCVFTFCRTWSGSRLFETQSELAVGYAETLSDDEGLSRALRVLMDSGNKVPPRPDPDAQARDLGRWLDLVSGAIGPGLGWSRKDTGRLARHLLLGLKCLKARQPDDISTGGLIPGLVATNRNGEIQVTWPPVLSGGEVAALLGASEMFAGSVAGGFSDPECRVLCRGLEGMDPSRRGSGGEVMRLADIKLRSEMLLRVFLDADAEHASWKLGLTEPLEVEQAISGADLYVFDPLRLDLASCGMGRVFEALEKLALYAWDADRDLKRSGGRQLDMFGVGREEMPRDPFNWVFARALRVNVALGGRETVAYLLASHVLDLLSRPEFSGCPYAPLTSLPQIFITN